MFIIAVQAAEWSPLCDFTTATKATVHYDTRGRCFLGSTIQGCIPFMFVVLFPE
jgi:hypothetical protein